MTFKEHTFVPVINSDEVQAVQNPSKHLGQLEVPAYPDWFWALTNQGDLYDQAGSLYNVVEQESKSWFYDAPGEEGAEEQILPYDWIVKLNDGTIVTMPNHTFASLFSKTMG